jgi:hypothetical protein
MMEYLAFNPSVFAVTRMSLNTTAGQRVEDEHNIELEDVLVGENWDCF